MTRFYIEGAEEFDRACRLLDKRDKTPKIFLPGGISTTRIIPRFRLPLTRKL